MTEQYLKEKIQDTLYNSNAHCGGTYQCVQIAKDYAEAQKEQESIEFASFLRRNCQADNNFLYWWYAGEKYNEKQLYQLFKNRENER